MSDGRDNANGPALATNGEERASADQYPAEHDSNPLQSPYAPKKELEPTIKEHFARSGGAGRRSSEGLHEHLEQRDIDIHEPFFFSRDATSGQQELERLPASVERHAVENDDDPLQSPKKEPAQPAVEEHFAISQDAALLASEDFREHLERRAADVHEPSVFSRDANGNQQDFERLIASIHAVEREEVAARLPKAAQLASVPGLASVGDGTWPHYSLEPDYLARRDALRGPRTMIKMSFLIVGILSVPIAYYFWMGGWDTIPGASSPEVASFNSKPIIPPPKSLSEEETGERAAQRDAQTPIPVAAAASPTATTDRTAVEAQTPIPPPRPTAMTPVSEQNVTPSDQSNADEIVILLKRGQELMRYGDLAAARLALRHAADAKNAEAALTLGATYDPVILRELRVYGLSADVGMARTWYEKAKELGSPEAARRLDSH